MREYEICELIGKSSKYISVMKYQRSKRYRYLMVLGKGNIEKGLIKYENYSIELKNKLIDICFEFENEDVWVHISKDDFNEYIT